MHFPKRIYGIENEFGVIGEFPSGQRTDMLFDDEEGISCMTLSPIEHSVIATLPQPRVWHSNGSCTYIDTGFHPEHATAECKTVHDVVRFNKAGEILSARMFGRRTPYGLKFFLFKNNQGYDEQGNVFGGFGCHENYHLYGLGQDDAQNLKPMIPFLITRQIFDGAGSWNKNSNWYLSQRAHSIDKEFGHGSTTGGRSIIQMKLGDTGSTPRMHVILGDANILEFAIYLKMGTTALVLALLEANRCPNTLCINSIDTLKLLAATADPYTPIVKMENGNTYSALQTQFLFLDAIQKELPAATFASDDVQAEVTRIAYYWDTALHAIENRDEAWMLGRFDYATKRYLIEKEILRSGVQSESQKLLLRKNFNILYHGVSDRTLQKRMNKMWSKRRIVTDTEISDALLNPPLDTRARMRGVFVRALVDKDKNVPFIDWTGVGDTNGPPHRKFRFDDPFNSDAPGFDSFLFHLDMQ